MYEILNEEILITVGRNQNSGSVAGKGLTEKEHRELSRVMKMFYTSCDCRGKCISQNSLDYS